MQGCVKGNNCTYIHDENYAGRPSPRMQNFGMGPNSYGDSQQGSQGRISE